MTYDQNKETYYLLNSMRFMPHEMCVIKNALNDIYNNVGIPEYQLKLGTTEKQYQLLLNKVA